MPSPDFASVEPTATTNSLNEIDVQLAKVADVKDDWIKTSIARRIELLEQCIDATADAAPGWVEAGTKEKGLDPEGPMGGEEWLSGPVPLLRNLRLYRDALKHDGQPPLPGLRRRANGQHVAQVFPDGMLDKIMLGGFTAEVWIEPGKSPSQGQIYRDKMGKAKEGSGKANGKVCLVLGAGNVSSIGPMDALYKLFIEDEVVLLKTNPVNAYLKPHWERALKPLVDEGVFAIVNGGAEVGAHLVHHKHVDTIHMTGSDRTHDAIVWGSDPEEQARRKTSGEKVVDKPMSSELGAVTPVLIVPGPWTDDDVAFQARNVAAMVANNASFNCNAAKVIVTAKGWDKGEALRGRIESELKKTPPRHAYYPGAQKRYDGFLAQYPNARKLGERSETVVPWTLIPDVPAEAGEYALSTEAFCGVVAETRLDATNAGEFIEKMVPFANDACWGTLSCMIIIHPETEKQHKAAFAEALAQLRYGGIAINCFAGVIYALVSPTWGAYPGHPDEDIRSGRGFVHNGYMIDHPEKSVVRAPFRIKPTPAWFADHKNTHGLGPALTRFEAKPSLLRLPSVVAAALRG